MKKIQLYLCALVLVSFLFACDEEPKDAVAEVFLPGDMKTGFATFEKNGLLAKGTSKCYKNWKDSFNMSIYTFMTDGQRRENYAFGLVPFKKGLYKLTRRDLVKRLTGGEMETVFKNNYILDTNKDNFIEITSIDSLKIKGKFQMYLQIDKAKETANEPDYLSIEKGYFEADLK